ncbi:MAG: glycosyltransferase family 4 protein [Candidatus Bathyarchaeota archaeon]|nr:glycosyltransferase family 4 protein [Candidatus Bathyarchaeota archaeon]
MEKPDCYSRENYLGKKTIRLACVDYRQWYSPFLLKSLSRLYPNFTSFIYRPKYYKKIPFSSEKRLPKDPSAHPKIWSTYSFPFDILKRALHDRVNIVHIQWEFNEFGVFYASILLPLLLLFLRIAKIKSVTTIHSVLPRYDFKLNLPGFTLPKFSKKIVESAFILLYRLIASLSNEVIVHGDSLKLLLCHDYKSDPRKVSVIPYGVAPVAYSSAPSRRFDDYIPVGSEVILALGAVSPRKGLDTLIKAFEKLSFSHPSWVLVIAGHVPSYYQYYQNYLTELASNLIKQKRVIFLGAFNLQDTDRLMDISKIIVFPYIYNFGASSTLTFALQHRKLVVISELNFARDLLTDGENAILVPPQDPVALASSIDRAMSDSTLRLQIQKGVDDLLRKSSWDYVSEKTLYVYNKVLSEN